MNMYSGYALEVKELTKIYPASSRLPTKIALDALNLSIKQGSFFGLLGSNGAGKSTLINILANTVTKTSGTAKIMGYDIDQAPKSAKSLIGVVPQEIIVDSFFSIEQSLEFTAGYYGIRPKDRKTTEILKALGLYDKRNNYPRQLSGGMKRRFLVAKAMIHSPSILILDEPTAGVDIELREQLWHYVKKLNNNGCTIIITTHYLEEAQELCTELAFINKGKIVRQDTKDNLFSNFGTKYLEIEFTEELTELVCEQLKTLYFSILSPFKVRYPLEANYNINSILSLICTFNLPIKDFQIIQLNLGDIFKQVIA